MSWSIIFIIAQVGADWEASTDREVPAEWLSTVLENIRKDEYKPLTQEKGIRFNNREQGLRALFEEDGVELTPRIGKWELRYKLLSIGEPPLPNTSPYIKGDTIIFDYGIASERYTNLEPGIAQELVIYSDPEVDELIIKLAMVGDLEIRDKRWGAPCIAGIKDRTTTFIYGANIYAVDARNEKLHTEVDYDYSSSQANIRIQSANAIYPIYVYSTIAGSEQLAEEFSLKGLSPTPNWTADPTDQNYAYFGRFVSTAGDVNGDGYSDVIIGAHYWDGAATIDEGRAFVYYGNGAEGAVGLSLIPTQARGAGNILIQILNGGNYTTNNFWLKILTRNPAGRGKVKLQWELKQFGINFDATNLGLSANWTDVGGSGGPVAIIENITSSLVANQFYYHWRVRLKYSPLTYNGSVYSRWLSIQGKESSAWNEQDLKTKGPIAVEMVGFSAIGGNGYIELSWQTEVEIDNYKWLIVRAEGVGNAGGVGDGYEQIAEVPVKGSFSDYQYVDSLVGLDKSSPYWYKLGDVDMQGNITWHGPVKATCVANTQVRPYMWEAIPNPFTQKTIIRLKDLQLEIYDLGGRLVRSLPIDNLQSPITEVVWDGKDNDDKSVPSGIYFCSIWVPDFMGISTQGEENNLTYKLIHIK